MKFAERALVKVYMERRDVERVEVVAGKAGVAEWVRNLILRKLGHGDGDEKDVQWAGDLGMGRGGAGASGGRAVSGVAELGDARARRSSRGGDAQARVAEVSGNPEPERTQPLTGSSPVPATKISLEDVVQETRGKQKEYGSLEHRVARRTGHPVGHECLECMGALRFEESLDRAEKQGKKSKQEKEEKQFSRARSSR